MTTLPANAGHAPIAELVRAYMAAEYRWQHEGEWHDLRIGLQAPGLELLYADADSFGMVSAWNPRSVERDERANRDADVLLQQDLAATGLPFLAAFGSALDRSWREPGWVVIGMTVNDFDALSVKYGQLGTLWWTRGKAGYLRVDAARPGDFGADEHITWLQPSPASA